MLAESGECRTRDDARRAERLKPRAALLAKRPPAREQDPKQPIPTTEARATSSAALEHGDLMAQLDGFQHHRRA
jgi:hypothetical protein